jgi:hypothetical protein
MMRKFVPVAELLAIINTELAGLEDCTGCRVRGIVALLEPDDDGCNWSEPHVSCSGAEAQLCAPLAAQIIARARAGYNLAT